MNIRFPRKFLFLINEPARFKILYGGRGGAKTETIAMALIMLARARKLRIACFREFQASIGESVHETIKNRISEMGLDDEFDVQDTIIISKRTGSEFIFKGLRRNINSIKSLARIDIAWVEEAVNVSKSSWEKLGPTIRGKHEDDPTGMGGPFKLGPEIWLSFNPELDTDETYRRFVVERNKYAPDFDTNGNRYAFVIKVDWRDNPWFPPDLRRDMELLKAADETEWLNVWEGHTKQTLDGAIYAKEIKKLLLDGRLGHVPYKEGFPVYTFWDLGHSDHTAIWFIQRIGMNYNIINYYQNHLEKIGHYLEVLQDYKYLYGAHYLPHDAENETLASMSIDKIVRKATGQKVIIVPRVKRKVIGINAVRTVFPLCNFDEENTRDGMQCLRRYAYKVNDEGQFSKEPDHNEWSHGADGFQTFALSLKPEMMMTKKKPEIERENNIIRVNPNAWMSNV